MGGILHDANHFVHDGFRQMRLASIGIESEDKSYLTAGRYFVKSVTSFGKHQVLLHPNLCFEVFPVAVDALV